MATAGALVGASVAGLAYKMSGQSYTVTFALATIPAVLALMLTISVRQTTHAKNLLDYILYSCTLQLQWCVQQFNRCHLGGAHCACRLITIMERLRAPSCLTEGECCCMRRLLETQQRWLVQLRKRLMQVIIFLPFVAM